MPPALRESHIEKNGEYFIYEAKNLASYVPKPEKKYKSLTASDGSGFNIKDTRLLGMINYRF